jgi:hypothetical protein
MGEKEKKGKKKFNRGKGGGGLLHYSPFVVFFFTFQLYGIEALFGFNSQMHF